MFDEKLDYKYDNCYQLNSTFKTDNNNMDLDDFLNNNFILEKDISIQTDSNNPLKKCINKASENHKDFFLVTNLNYNNSNKEFLYDCYIPKQDQKCDFSNISELVNPFNDVLKNLLGHTDILRKTILGTDKKRFLDLSTNNYNTFTDNGRNNQAIVDFKNAQCYSLNNDLSAGKIDNKNEYYSTFALYKTELILNDNVDNILSRNNNLYSSYKSHKNNYDVNFNKEKFNILLENIIISFQDYLCSNKNNSNLNDGKKNTFNSNLNILGNYYEIMFTKLNELSKDISNAYIITKHDLYRLNLLEEKIKERKKILKDLLNYHGASNGKLFDTKYLKNIKLSETIILSLIIIFLIYFYAKKK